MVERPALPLGELCDSTRGITYGIVKVGDFVPNGIPVIRGGDIRGNRIVFSDEKRVTREVSEQFRRTILRGGELVINLIAEPGHCAIVPPSMAGFNVSRDVAVIPLVDYVNHSYVNWYLKSPQAIEWLSARLSGSVTQKINLGILRQVPIPLPGRPCQDAIADVLGALDDKIALNERLAITTGELLSATYSNAINEAKCEFSERPLSDVAAFINGRAFTKDATGTGRMVIRIAEINSGPGPSTIYNDMDVSERHLARPGDVLFAWSGSLTVARWYRPEAIINQHIFKVIPKGNYPIWLPFELVKLKLADFRSVAADKATTMGHIQRRHLDELVPTPSTVMLQKLEVKCNAFWARALAAEQESLTLAELRDALLPELMSGRLRVRDAEQIVEDAL
ncbi:restriction endonuclease subunit S [Microtetraspora malaysiensis]|uniref:restriction endonuclease subunit S n=1 Tax=Microtetraspora malaysiensis TaxID=161358 RepID=UPI003D946363